MEIQTIVTFASKISTPLVLAGVVVAVLWGVFRLILQKSPVWAKKDAAPIVIRIISWIGILSLASIILGFVGFFITETDFKLVRKKTPILKVNQPNDSKERDVIINRETAMSIAQQVNMKPTHTAIFGEINKERYIAAPFMDDYEIVIFRQAGSIWKKELSFPCDSSCNYYEYPKWEFAEIENKLFLFVESDEIGNAGGAISLSLFSFEDKREYSLSISGNYREEETKDDTISYLEGPYIIEKNYDQLNYKNISKYLEEKIEKSGWFPKQTDEDVNMSNPKNAEKKWVIDNYALYNKEHRDVIEYHKLKKQKITMTRYKDNLFDMQKNVSIMDEVENNRYFIKVYFKGPVVAFDKISKEYFIVFIPPDPVALWIEKLSFVKGSINKLAISIASTTDKDELSKGIGADWIIDLEEKIFL